VRSREKEKCRKLGHRVYLIAAADRRAQTARPLLSELSSLISAQGRSGASRTAGKKCPGLARRYLRVGLVPFLLLAVLLFSCAPARRPVSVPPPPPKARIYREVGYASWYGKDFHGRPTSSGEIYNMYGFTAAHRTLPLGTRAEVTNPENGRSVRVRINDRGPFIDNRFLDLSYGAAKEIDIVEKGVAKVRLEAWAEEKELSSRHFTVQVGAFLIEENAKRLKQRMERYGPSFISQYQTNRQTFYRVRVGDFREEGQAEALSRNLAKEGFSPFVVCAD